jgi:hypothetical protein
MSDANTSAPVPGNQKALHHNKAQISTQEDCSFSIIGALSKSDQRYEKRDRDRSYCEKAVMLHNVMHRSPRQCERQDGDPQCVRSANCQKPPDTGFGIDAQQKAQNQEGTSGHLAPSINSDKPHMTNFIVHSPVMLPVRMVLRGNVLAIRVLSGRDAPSSVIAGHQTKSSDYRWRVSLRATFQLPTNFKNCEIKAERTAG